MLPLYEAVVNSIHAIEEAGISPSDGKIIIEILRKKQIQLGLENEQKKPGPETNEDILGFKIFDNGIGFNEINLNSFQTLDSEHKASIGCRGVGRLLWLKAFSQVHVKSTYKSTAGSLRTVSFVFNAAHGVENIKHTDNSDIGTETCVHLDGFLEKYRENSFKTTRPIANSLLDHCLWYFVRQGGAPKIKIKDDDLIIELDDVYEDYMFSSSKTETFKIKNAVFDLTHLKITANSSQSNFIAFCAANRLVKKENITGKIPALYGKIVSETGDFNYACYVSSTFLDERVRSERTDFDIEEDIDGFFSQTDLSLNEIRTEIFKKITEYLFKYLDQNKKVSKDRIDNFVSNTAPRYRPILSRISEDKLIIDPNISDKELDLVLHKCLSDIEGKLIHEGHDLMLPRYNEKLSDYQKRLHNYLRTVEDIKKSDLANYVSHRKVILDLLEQSIQIDQHGKYAREELIHGLIMPMRLDSNQVMPDDCNLWLIDERLAFHNYLASDKSLSAMPITGNMETKEPDICALNIFDNPILVSEDSNFPLASIVVIEIKRPMRNDAQSGEDKDPIEQALGYLDRIRNGNVTTANGRLIPNSKDIPGYCYAICDITPTIVKRCMLHGLTVTTDNMGYFGYNPNFKAYIEVISFDRLVRAAKERNRAFFDKLGLPSK